MDKIEQNIFKKGSTTYYLSSQFFPKDVRTDIFRLYSFVRVADDYVDEKPAQPQKLLDLEKAYIKAVEDDAYEVTTHDWDDVDERVIKNIVRLTHKYKFEKDWIQAFFASMKSDIKPTPMLTLEDSLRYVHGSAEVIGLMLAKIMQLSDEALEYSKLQGRAMQWINFVRDIQEDNELGRCYFPQTELKKHGLKSLEKNTTESNKIGFEKFINYQIERYKKWQNEAAKGFSYIPLRLRVPLQIATDMYAWTADEIAKNPFSVFETKVKPSKRQVLQAALKNGAKLAKPDLDFLKKS